MTKVRVTCLPLNAPVRLSCLGFVASEICVFSIWTN
jgi:hypothetical protein